MSTEQAISVSGTTSTEATPVAVEAAPSTPVDTPKPPEKTKEELEFASRFAALTKREKSILHQQRMMQEKAKDLEALTKYEEAKKSAKNNPIAVLESLGLDYKYLTDFILNDNKPTTEGKLGTLEQQVQALTQQLAEKAQVEEQMKQERAVNEFKGKIKDHVEKNADAYELIRVNNAFDTVYEVACSVYDETGEIPDIDEVAKNVEAHLESELDKLKEAKKVRSRFAPPPTEPQASIPVDTKPSLSKTLTNAGVSAVPQATKSNLSPDESVRRAAAMLKWN